MKHLLFLLFVFSFRTGFSQNDVFLHPFVGEDNSEVILAYNRKTGASVEWYYDLAEEKMKKADGGFQLPADKGITGPLLMKAYIDAQGTEVILIWNAQTGKSKMWYYDRYQEGMNHESPLQLPDDPGVTGDIQMFPYVNDERDEVILVWDTKTGKSVSWYYDKGEGKFLRSETNFQLPANPGVAGKMMMHPYLDFQKSEVILVWDMISGKSISWYYDLGELKFKQAEARFQLGASPGVTGNVMMFPYIAPDGSEVVLTWSVNTGQSVYWYFNESESKMTKAASNYQLPGKSTITQNVMMFPFINATKDEVVFIWNAATGQSENYYFDLSKEAYQLSEPQFQLPSDPLK